MANRAPVTCYQEFKELVKVLVDGFLTWSKFTAPGLDGCPNLAKKSVAKLRVSRDVEEIEDLARVVETKRLRVEEFDVEVDDEGNRDDLLSEGRCRWSTENSPLGANKATGAMSTTSFGAFTSRRSSMWCKTPAEKLADSELMSKGRWLTSMLTVL